MRHETQNMHLPTPTQQRYIADEYSNDNPTWHSEDSPWKARQIMRVLEPYQGDRPLTVCEIGCGVGGVLAALDEIFSENHVDSQFVGYDIAPIAIERARATWHDRERIEFRCADILDSKRLNYDLCLLIDVLEHLDDPLTFLSQLCDRGLRTFIIHLPLENHWLGILRGLTDPRRSPVGHLHFYDTHSAISLLERAGLVLNRWVYTPEADLDIRLHRTAKSVLAYLPRKFVFWIAPALTVHSIGGAAFMARCTVSRE